MGAVARDRHGHVAAATSTGGRICKRLGRVGDSPVIGAGTYADDGAGGCSVTGDGEAILRMGLARSAIELLRARVHPEDAAQTVLQAMVQRLAATGGIILVDSNGQLGLARTTAAMPWAAASDSFSALTGS